MKEKPNNLLLSKLDPRTRNFGILAIMCVCLCVCTSTLSCGSIREREQIPFDCYFESCEMLILNMKPRWMLGDFCFVLVTPWYLGPSSGNHFRVLLLLLFGISYAVPWIKLGLAESKPRVLHLIFYLQSLGMSFKYYFRNNNFEVVIMRVTKIILEVCKKSIDLLINIMGVI